MKVLFHSTVIAFAAALATSVFAADINVDTTTDENDGSCGDGDCSIRDALAIVSAGDRVLIPAGTYPLSIGPLEPAVSGEIVGAGAQQTTIDGGDAVQVLEISGGIDVTVGSLTIANGNSGRGGGIQIFEASMTLRDCIVRNSAAFNAGGIAADFDSVVTIERCAIIDNLADGNSGGGIAVSGSDVTVVNSTISGNQAPTSSRVGGGIGVFTGTRGDDARPAVLRLRNSTVVNNGAEASGGNIFTDSSVAVIASNTVIADSTSGGDCNQSITSEGWNLDGDGTCGMAATGDLSATAPQLGARALNGGSTPSHAPNAGSPLNEAGNPAPVGSTAQACAPTDQRGVLRPQDGRCEIGSFEVEGEPPGLPEARPIPVLTPGWGLLLIALTVLLAGATFRRPA